jgi:TolB-like protein
MSFCSPLVTEFVLFPAESRKTTTKVPKCEDTKFLWESFLRALRLYALERGVALRVLVIILFFWFGLFRVRSLLGIFLATIVLLASCATGPVTHKEGTTIAVWDLENLISTEYLQHDLGELLSAKIIETLKETGNYTIVERERLLLALEELNLGTTSLADESSRLRIGRMLGAQLMVFGAYQVIANQMRLDLRLVDVETGKILRAAQQTTPHADFPKWLKAAAETAAELFQ